jgi:signal peptidase I
MLGRISFLLMCLMLAGLMAVYAPSAIWLAQGTQTVIVDGSSMQQVLPMGSIAAVEPVTQPQIGDWIVYPHNGHRVTHEVIEIAPNPATAERDGLWLQTKGTNNDAPDPYVVNRDDVQGRVVAHYPALGVIQKTLQAPVVQAFLGLLVLTLWLISRPPRPRTVLRKEPA